MKQQQQLIPMSTGEYLSQCREKRKLSLARVAKAISLDEKLLEEIERGQAQHIAAVYRKGYIRTYAKYLDIPEDEIQSLLADTDDRKPEVHNVFSVPPKRNPLDKWLRATSYVLASLLIGTLAWQFTHEAVRLSQSGSRLSGVETKPPAIDTVTSQGGEIKGTVNASIAPLGVLHDTGTDGLDTAEQAWAAISHPGLPDGESRLQINVSADSWVEITDANDQQLEMDLLRGGSEKGYHGKPPFRILLGRASAVHLSFDGEPVDLADFVTDDVARLTLPQQLQSGNSGLTDQ